MIERVRRLSASSPSDQSPVRGRPFKHGNPGRPPGSKNKLTRLLEELVENEGGDGRPQTHRAREGGNVRCLEYLLGLATMALADLAERTQCARGKKEKCTALFHHLSVEHLAALLELQENRGARGRGKAYEANLERNLGDCMDGCIEWPN